MSTKEIALHLTKQEIGHILALLDFEHDHSIRLSAETFGDEQTSKCHLAVARKSQELASKIADQYSETI